MKNRIAYLTIALCLSLLSGVLTGCANASLQLPQPAQAQDSTRMVASGSWYSREPWPHDGHPYESLHFIVYSDAASQAARESIANVVEDLLAELVVEFGIVPAEMFRFPPGQSKIHIYAYKNYFPQEWGMRAYYAGLIAWSLDHERRATDLESYKPVLKHELVHVFEALLKGRDVSTMPADVRVQAWFSEGLPEAVTGGNSGGAIRGLDQVNALTAQYGQRNPVAYKTDGVIDNARGSHPMIGYDYYYPMSQLAVEYLLDADGLGKSLQDVRDLFLDMAGGADFSTAFEDRMGLSISDYEASFFERMDAYLPEGESMLFVRLSRLWLYLTAGSLILVTLSLARRTDGIQGIKWAWVLLVAFFGPLGLLCYLLSVFLQGRRESLWWRALVVSLVSVTGNAAGLIAVKAFYHFFTPAADAGPLILVVPLLVGWLVFRTPHLSAHTGVSYWAAARRSLIAVLISSALVLAGMLPLLIILPNRVWFLSQDPTSPFFLGLISLSALAGTLLVYPYSLWMVRRESARQPGPARLETAVASGMATS